MTEFLVLREKNNFRKRQIFPVYKTHPPVDREKICRKNAPYTRVNTVVSHLSSNGATMEDSPIVSHLSSRGHYGRFTQESQEITFGKALLLKSLFMCQGNGMEIACLFMYMRHCHPQSHVLPSYRGARGLHGVGTFSQDRRELIQSFQVTALNKNLPPA